MITGLDHVNIATAKLDETRDFLCTTFGLEVGQRPKVASAGYWLYAGGRPIVHLGAGEPDRPAKGVIDHFSFATDDLPAVLARLDQLGVEYKSMAIPDGLGVQAFCHGPGGIKIEITSRTPIPAREPQAAEEAAIA